MPHPKIHEMIDRLIFGKSFSFVHWWMDGRFNGKNGRVHWIYRHHEKAIREHFDNKVLRQVARLHVLVDWLFYYKIAVVPRDENEVKRLLEQHGVFVKDDE